MSEALQVLSHALHDLWDDLWTAAVCNVIWLVSQVLIVPGPPATLALFYYGNRLAHGEVADLGDFWSALRRYWKPAWRWGALNLALLFILVGDAWLTPHLSRADTAQFVQGFYLAVLAVWLFLQLYTLPFLFEQEQPEVRRALRNAAVMLGRNVGFSVALAVLLAGILFVGTLLFFFSVAGGGVLLAIVGNRAVLNRMAIRSQSTP